VAANVKYIHEGDIHTVELGVAGLEKIIIDYTGVPTEERTGIARALLAAASLSCYATALEKLLTVRGASFESIVAEATLTFATNEAGQARIEKMDLDAVVEMNKDDSAIYDRCSKIMKQGCLITRSLHEGIEMSYALKADFKE